MHLLENEYRLNSIVVMVQKEAAERICAPLGTRKAGAISVAVRYFGEPEVLFGVNKTCFIPQPSVDSSVIKIKVGGRKEEVKDKKNFFKVVKAALSLRRKNLVNSLSSGLGVPKNEVSEKLAALGLDRNLRAENLKFDDFLRLSQVF